MFAEYVHDYLLPLLYFPFFYFLVCSQRLEFENIINAFNAYVWHIIIEITVCRLLLRRNEIIRSFMTKTHLDCLKILLRVKKETHISSFAIWYLIWHKSSHAIFQRSLLHVSNGYNFSSRNLKPYAINMKPLPFTFFSKTTTKNRLKENRK